MSRRYLGFVIIIITVVIRIIIIIITNRPTNGDKLHPIFEHTSQRVIGQKSRTMSAK